MHRTFQRMWRRITRVAYPERPRDGREGSARADGIRLQLESLEGRIVGTATTTVGATSPYPWYFHGYPGLADILGDRVFQDFHGRF